MDYKKVASDNHSRLPEFFETRTKEMRRIFCPEIITCTAYERLICRLMIVMGDVKVEDTRDECIRDLIADIFDALYFSRYLLTGSHDTMAFATMRRGYEAISLMSYFWLCPEKAEAWDKGTEISNGEIRKYLNEHPMGENGEELKKLYKYFSKGTHLNRDYVPIRMHGKGNKFTLGAIGLPNVLTIGHNFEKLIRLWFWFGAMSQMAYINVLPELDAGMKEDYLSTAKLAKQTIKDLNYKLRHLRDHPIETELAT